MKFMVVLAVVGVAAAASPFRTSYRAPGGGRYIVTQDNSFEFGGRDTSLEYVRRVDDLANVGAAGGPSGRTRSSRVKALSHMLNAGYVDASDEYRFRSNLARATALGGKNYYINDSGELFYRQGASVPQSGPSAAAGQGVQVA
ncbi:uncharacterized protein LOC122259480 isoform X2 [Penaeus japonicus]|uniref:uncharacterized protein LOC122259480 isoform X2 n=1 Tax=Penaeus japonicus TaxID=27405 RepID=UPI001C7124DF|nr:uncharacterized protein LOC122259480 isoform X2 [Penaeus japonicus]